MNIIFSPEYSGIVYLKPADGMGVMMDMVVVNTIGLVNMLELRMGLHYDELPEQERVARYFDAVSQYMDAHPDNVMAASFNTSGLATAKAMLSWRDELRSAEWDFDGKEISERLAVLIGVEDYFRKQSGCDMPGRLHIVTDQVDFQKLDCQQMEIQLPVDKKLFKPSIQKLIDVLQAHGAKVEVTSGAVDSGNNLSKVRELVFSKQKGKIILDKEDESIQIWKFADERAACEYLSYHEMEEVDVWINADNKQMDNWLKLMGKATTGSVVSGSTPQLTQLFVMGLGLFANPLNVHTLVGWLQMPVHPLDKFFRSVLADTIVREGGYRNEACAEKIKHYVDGGYVYLDDEQKALPEEEQKEIRLKDKKKRQKLIEVFLPALSADSVIKTEAVRRFVQELSVWSRQHAHFMSGEADNEQWIEQLMVVSGMCDAFGILLDTTHEDTIDYKTIDSWMSTIGQKDAYTNAIAERGCRMVIDNPAKMASVAEKTVWIGVDGEVGQGKECGFLYPSEKTKLVEQAFVHPWEEKKETNYHELMQLMPLRMTSGQLVLVVRERVGGEPVLKHPLIVRLEQQVENINDFIRYPCVGVENRHQVEMVEHGEVAAEMHFDHADKIQWPDHLSPTKIGTLVEYPFDYLMENLLDITGDGMDQMADVKKTKGNVAHAVIETLFAPRGNCRYSSPAEIAIRIEQEFEDAYAKAVEGKGAILQLAENQMAEKLLCNQLRNCLDVLLDILQENELKVTGCERCLKADDVLGIIDMTLEDKNGRPVVFDFKWTTWNGYQEMLKENRSIQLEYYRWLLEYDTKDQVERVAYFIMPDAMLYSKEAFQGKHCMQLTPENRHNIVEQLRQSILYRKEQIAGGVIETNGVYEELQYVKDTDARRLFPLKKTAEGTKVGNFFTQYGLFNK